MDQIIIGIVENGEFRPLWPGRGALGTVDLTSIRPQEARSPESGRIALREYEGKAIAVQGNDQGGWIYSASVIDAGGPLVTALVQKVFGPEIDSS
jgi:hypothetical protein